MTTPETPTPAAARYEYGEKQELLRESARKFLEARFSTTRVRELLETERAHDEAAWKDMADLGWHGILVPEEHGGVGLELFELGVLLEEMGRVVVPGPYLAAQLATLVILGGASDEQRAAWLSAIAEGSAIPTLALFEDDAGWDATPGGTKAKSAGASDGFKLSGTKRFVLDAINATHLVVSAKAPDGPALFRVDARARGVDVLADKLADETRRSATVIFENVAVSPADRIGGPGEGATLLARTLPSVWCALAAELVGAAHRVFHATVDYARVREQFGRPIGSFQGIKHRLVDRMVELENARSLVYGASWAQRHEPPARAERLARMAKAYVSDAGPRIADTAVRTHGGIGFTWECDVHLYWKRLHWGQMAFGDGAFHREAIAVDLERTAKPVGGPTPTGI
ncbi:MAG: acyl-CoA/acyl-ACP dehydrogenase [Deltaproteobacteria bacterium]|nr:acyl-CoA/acyl-ACP dehydrogenase [Deltaproteobacteria bacterium]